MKPAPLLATVLLVSACASVAPLPIRSGDVCFNCRRTIVDTSLAAEIISPEGRAFKFNSVVCLSEYLRDHPNEQLREVFVTDHGRQKLLPADDAWFVKFETAPPARSTEFAAFRDKGVAQAFASENRSDIIDWAGVLQARVEHSSH
jgi:hypothetical protein